MRLTLLAVGYTDSPALKSLTAEYACNALPTSASRNFPM